MPGRGVEEDLTMSQSCLDRVHLSGFSRVGAGSCSRPVSVCRWAGSGLAEVGGFERLWVFANTERDVW